MDGDTRRSLRLLCGEDGKIECKHLCVIWSRSHLRSMYRRDDEISQCRDGDQAEHYTTSQGAEQAGFSVQNGSAEVKKIKNAGDTFFSDNRHQAHA